MFKKLILKFLLISIIFGSGGFDHGKSAGKGNLDLSLTWNPFNYFKQGQSYIIFGYGITNKLDIHFHQFNKITFLSCYVTIT